MMLRVIWKLIISALEAIGIMIAFCYIFSGFGVLFALACIGVMFGGSPTSDIIISSIVFTLIICSWIVFGDFSVLS